MTRRIPSIDCESQANDLLSARATPAAGEIIALIRRVNPTPRSLPRAVEERRYTLKSRLQSLLIRLYPEDIAVEPGADGAPDVGLRHRYLGLDACHARVDTLDEDARSWVRLQLDLGVGAMEAEARAVGGDADVDGSPAGLVRRGREAMVGFDYEAAESLLREALSLSNGAAFVVDALFELLVDTLALDAAAITLAPDLSPGALKQPSIRAALALACVRTGRIDEGVTWLEGARGSRAADALACLAREALGREDLPKVTRWLEALRAEDPAHVEAVAIGVLLDRRRAELERPLIEARRREREAQEQARAQELETVLAEAQSATDVRALQLYERAQALGAEVSERLTAVRERLAEAERLERIVRSVEALETQPVQSAALVAYGTLDETTRSSVRELLASDAPAQRLIAWMEELTFDGSGAKVRAAAEAVLALATALTLDDAQAALATMHPHARLLSRVGDARRLEEQANATLKARAQEAASAAEAARLEAERIQREARRAQEKVERADRAHRLASKGNPLAAQHEGSLVRRQAEDDAERARWDELLAEWGRAAALQWAWEEVQGAAADGDLSEVRALMPLGLMSNHCLMTGGRSWVVVASFGEHLFAVEVALDTRRIVRRVRLRLPAPILVSKVLFRDDSLWLLGSGGELVEIGWAGREVRRAFSLARLTGVDAFTVGDFLLPCGTTLVWVINEAARGAGTMVVDPDALRVVWRDNDVTPLSVLNLSSGPVVVRSRQRGPADVRDVEGGRLTRAMWPRGWALEEIAVHPDGERLVGLLTALPAASSGDAEGGEGSLALADWSEAHPLRLRPIEATPADLVMLEVSHEDGLVFLLRNPAGDGAAHVVALKPEPDGLRELYRHPVAKEAVTLMSDEASRRVVLLDFLEELRVDPLGASPPPQRPLLRPGSDFTFPRFMPPFGCYASSDSEDDATLAKRLATLDDAAAFLPELRALTKKMKRAVEPEQTEAYAAELGELLEKVFHSTKSVAATDIVLAMSFARGHAARGAWDKVEEILALFPEDDLSPADFDHRRHLLGLARWHQGDLPGALELWKSPRQAADPCGLQAAVRYTEAMLDEHARRPGHDMPTRTLAAMFAVDEALEASDFRRAWAALQSLDSLVLQDVQVAARHATACLARDPTDERERHRIALSLSRFLFSHAHSAHPDEPLTRMFHLGPKHWGDDALERLAERARTWLEADAARIGLRQAG